ncbi:MAG TPA: hypothetical protein PKA50_15280 [Gemmatimonadales bacterium]|nr:hypothetical protein [Gemmatimonadales bacterium]
MAVYLDPTGEFVYGLSVGRQEFYPASDFGLWATLKRTMKDLYAAGDSLGLFGILTLTNFTLWRRYKYWIPRYVHLLAFLALLTIVWLNWMWIQAGGQLTVRRVIIILTFPAIVYFFFVGAGGIKGALARRAAQAGLPPAS